jgi:signal transduction histidine kinase
MPGGGKLTIETKNNNSNISILIKDTGDGIPEEIIPQIFEPFFTTKNIESDSSGLGLGLSIVYGIVKRHGGIITVDSIIGEGSTFCITLPMNQVAEGNISNNGIDP